MRELFIVAGAAILVAMILIAVRTVMHVRKMAAGAHAADADELAEFQRMRDDGRISEQEYQRLRKIVARQTVERLRDDKT